MVFAFQALWCLATPVGASPDEPAHLIRAASVVRGQWVGPARAGFPNSDTVVSVPDAVVQLNLACFVGKPHVSAGCYHEPKTPARQVSTLTYVGHYPPL
ncbi:MAG: DUF2142 domain-containing protein, partial [Acidimicrobiales bacterium]